MKTSTPILCNRRRYRLIAQLFSVVFSILAINANAQNYLTENFDGSFLPTGWTSADMGGSSDGGGCGCTDWFQQSSYSGSPSIPSHSGSNMASYNSHNIFWGGEAILVTPAMDFTTYSTGVNTVSFWLYKSNDIADGYNGNEDDQINVWASTTPDLSSATLLSNYMNGMNNNPVVSSEGWYQYTLVIPSSFSSSSSVYIIFDAISDLEADLYIDDVSVDHIPPCSGMPTVSLVPGAANIIGCSGSKVTISGTAGLAPGQDLQWQISSSPTGPWTDITGATNTDYTIGSVTITNYYRLKDSCEGSGLVAYTLPDTVGAGDPAYAALPYVQDFENWQNFCDLLDVPGSNWRTTPTTGDGSWRRDDQGCSYGGWTSSGCYLPGSSFTVNSYYPYTQAASGSHCARFHSSPNWGGYIAAGGATWSGTMDLHVDCSGAGNKLLQFYFKNQAPDWISSMEDFLGNDNDSLDVFMSTDGGKTFNQIWGADTAQEWKKIQVQIPSTSATTIIRFLAKRNGGDPVGWGGTNDQTDIGLDSVLVAPACTGLASGGAIDPTGEISSCAGASYNLNITGIAPAGGITYQWQIATPSSPTFTDIPGQTGTSYTTAPLFDSVQYQVVVTCPYTSPATTMTSDITSFDVTPTPYAAINLPAPAGPGYHFSFESWNDHCSTTDQPVLSDGSTESNWINYPTDGYNTWRRDDEGYSAGWSEPWEYAPYEYSPVAFDSSHSARLSTYDHWGSGILTAHLYLFLDCSTVPGVKELQYYTNIGAASGANSDTISAWISTDGGNTFTMLRSDFNGDGSWKFCNANIPSTSPTTVIDFRGIYGDPNYSNSTGLGLDDVKIVLPCDGKPTAGVLTGDTVCSNETFKRQAIGTSEVAGLAYEWQESTDSVTWRDVNGDTTKVATLSYLSNTYLRVVVKCRNSGLSDTSNVVKIVIKPFYKCYCNPVVGIQHADIEGAIGNFSITKESTGDTVIDHTTVVSPITDNPWADELNYGDLSSLNGYTNFTDSALLPTVSPDSLYHFYITEVSPFSSFEDHYPIEVYIDYDHSGTFDGSAGELAFDGEATSVSLPTADDTVRIPHDAMLGLTGMRVMMGIYNSSPLDPCASDWYSNNGEIRDYLINIDYRPCNAAPNAGTATTTDSIMCSGYSFTLSDTSHEHHMIGLNWVWQYSPDGVTWGNMPGTSKRDTLTQFFTTTTWYRMAIVCLASNDTGFSNAIKIRRGEGYECYCFSAATGGPVADSSDIGAFTFGPFVMNRKGPHLLNPAATHSHTNFAGNIINLYVDTTYTVGLYHILKAKEHADAKVTLFIDYNNNHSYDVPNERVWTAYSTSASWYLTSSVTIPDVVISDVPTGMRLILNNDVGPNAASDDACGAYTSGETWDFVVRFNRAWTTGVGNISNLENLVMYPNPTDGKFKVSFNAQN
ncbi:MAG: GEVED domain-containing protein, partial [Flavipsychrobacter sp.]